MKRKSAFAANPFAIRSILSFNADAASDHPVEVKVVKAAPQKAMKRHSHVEAETGFTPKAPEAILDKANAANNRTKHVHPHDGK